VAPEGGARFASRPFAVTGGIFDVHVDGDLVFEKSMLGRYPDPDDVLPLVRDKLGAN
jgi:predicted Rdx family selenoprotein